MKYQIYGKEGCKYCSMASEAVQSRSLVWEYILVGRDITPEELKKKMGVDLGERVTVPQIWFGDKYIGGYAELMEYLEQISGSPESFD